MSNLQQTIDQLEPVFDSAVDGSDDELFAAGYLRGHFDLVAARLLMAGETRPEQLWPALKEAIDEASHELAPADRAHVDNFYVKLLQAA